MDYSRRDRADRLAAEYVLGTLRGPARRRFESLLPAHPALRDALAAWQARLLPLAASVPEVEPQAAVWQRIEAQLFAAPALRQPRWWQRLAPWRGFSAVTGLVALVLLVALWQGPSARPPIIIVLGSNPDGVQTLKASFVASVSADGRALVLRPLDNLTLSPGRALELWAVPAKGAPRSLGLVQPAGETTLLRTRLLQDTAAFAVSVEPAGGSPTGAPTGPIVSLGKLQA